MFAPEGDVGVQEIAGGAHAVAVHHGPYENLKDTYAWLMGTWLPQSGYEPGPCPSVEVYLNDPDLTPAEDLRTEIRIPLSRV